MTTVAKTSVSIEDSQLLKLILDDPQLKIPFYKHCQLDGCLRQWTCLLDIHEAIRILDANAKLDPSKVGDLLQLVQLDKLNDVLLRIHYNYTGFAAQLRLDVVHNSVPRERFERALNKFHE